MKEGSGRSAMDGDCRGLHALRHRPLLPPVRNLVSLAQITQVAPFIYTLFQRGSRDGPACTRRCGRHDVRFRLDGPALEGSVFTAPIRAFFAGVRTGREVSRITARRCLAPDRFRA